MMKMILYCLAVNKNVLHVLQILLDDDNRGLHSTALVWLDFSNDITKEQYKYFTKDNKFWKTLLIREYVYR